MGANMSEGAPAHRGGRSPSHRLPLLLASPRHLPAGFEFLHFEFGDRARLLQEFPGAAPWVERLMAD